MLGALPWRHRQKRLSPKLLHETEFHVVPSPNPPLSTPLPHSGLWGEWELKGTERTESSERHSWRHWRRRLPGCEESRTQRMAGSLQMLPLPPAYSQKEKRGLVLSPWRTKFCQQPVSLAKGCVRSMCSSHQTLSFSLVDRERVYTTCRLWPSELWDKLLVLSKLLIL